MCFGENYSMLLHMIVVLASFVFLEKDVEAAKKYNYAGCYETTDRSRILYQHVKKLDKLTPRTCVDWCHSMQSAYAGLQKNECRCDQYQPPEIIRRSFRDCGHLCPGDRNSRCGGGDHKISIYETGITTSGDDAIPARAYLGCYPDDDTDNRILKGSNYEFSDNTPSKCHKLCYRLGFRFFGLINVKYCICGDTPPSKGNAIPGENCQSICNGDENKYCGGDQKLSLYATGINNIPEFGRYLGCYDNSKLKDIKADITLNLTLTNSQGRCFNICDQKGFKYAGVQKGRFCRCGNDFASDRTPDGEEKCNISCPGNSSETCGGHKKYIQVYQIISNIEETKVGLSKEAIFTENFNTLDTSVWSYTVKIANEPNYEFVTYERSPAVVFLKGGKLFIKPKIQSDEYVQSSITLQNCTGKPIECTRKAQGYQILPPIQSGQLTTKNKFSFRYGKVEIRAKLPIGDWIVPEIWLAPTKYEYGDSYQSGQIRIAMVRGNKDLNCFDNHYGHKRLEMGVYISDESEVRRKVFYKMATESWSKAYHNYTVIWTPEKISFQVDSEEIGTIQPESHETIRQIVGLSEHAELTYANATNKLAPFDKEFHIALGISVGGITDFYDDCIANPKKPWSNTSPKAMLNFWKAKEQWIHTWTGNNSALQIEHVIVRPLSIKTS